MLLRTTLYNREKIRIYVCSRCQRQTKAVSHKHAKALWTTQSTRTTYNKARYNCCVQHGTLGMICQLRCVVYFRFPIYFLTIQTIMDLSMHLCLTCLLMAKTSNRIATAIPGCPDRCAWSMHKIALTSDEPFKRRNIPVPQALQGYMKDEIAKLVKHDIIEPSNSPYSNPVLLIAKPDKKSYRMVFWYQSHQQSHNSRLWTNATHADDVWRLSRMQVYVSHRSDMWVFSN